MNLTEVKQQIVLRNLSYNQLFILKIDALEHAIGAVLLQCHDPIGFYNKKLTATQRNYSIVEKELYGSLASLEFFKTIVFGNEP